jgi:hypothetical protein
MHADRVQQRHVFAQQSVAIAADFQQHIDKRLVDWLGGCDLDYLALAALLD